MSQASNASTTLRDTVPTSSVEQQQLPFAELAVPVKPAIVAPTKVRRLWFCILLPDLPLEACYTSGAERAAALLPSGSPHGGVAIVEEQHGIQRVLQANPIARAAGITPGQSANAALALLPELRLEERSLAREQQVLEALAAGLERFSSFVSLAGRNVLLLEIAGSLRLFAGLPNLRRQISDKFVAQGFSAALAIAPTPLAATWLARAGRRSCIRLDENIGPALRQLPLACLDWPAAQHGSLVGMGIRSIGDCLRLPREGFARRFGAERLLEFDRALGNLPDPRESWRAPERFCVDYEMTEEQSDRDLLLHICRGLLLAHERFLLQRELGTQRVYFSFFHLRNTASELCLGVAGAERSAERWFDLAKIRFEQLRLPEPVIAVRLRGGRSLPLQAETARLCFSNQAEKPRRGYSIAQLAERLVARIGAQSVNAVRLVAEHRPEYAWKFENPLSDCSASALNSVSASKRPLWVLPEPAALPADNGHPLRNGCRLTLLEGPERLETGWWDEHSISRDYYTAIDAAGIRLWVFRHRQQAQNWYLHGIFG